MEFETKSAIGERGFLIRTIENEVVFRVYDANHDFVDYEITNQDCEVVIIDPSAALIRHPAGDFLDYTDEALGRGKS